MTDSFNKLEFRENFIKGFIKDLGKKWFAFSKMERESFEMMRRAR